MADDPTGRLVRNLIALQRIANTVAEDVQVRQQELFEQIVDDLRRIDPAGPGAARYRRGRVDKFLRTVDKRLRVAAPEVEKLLKDRLAVVGRQQALYAQQTLVATLGGGAEAVAATPMTQARIRAILNTDPFEGRLLKEHVGRWRTGVLDKVRREVRMGMTAEETLDDIVRRVRGKQAGYIRLDPKTGNFVPKGTRGAVVRPRFMGGVLSKSTREVEALVRTAVNHVSTQGMLETYQANAGIVTGLRFVAALDDRTTAICLSLDGTVWELDSPDIQEPPLHFGCRSALVPEIDYEAVGLGEPPEGERSVRDPSDLSEDDLGRKVSARRRTGDLGKVTKVSSSVTATEWLRGQPAKVQDKMLGRGRARLFREGKITLKDLIRQDRSTVPLSELLEMAA